MDWPAGPDAPMTTAARHRDQSLGCGSCASIRSPNGVAVGVSSTPSEAGQCLLPDPAAAPLPRGGQSHAHTHHKSSRASRERVDKQADRRVSADSQRLLLSEFGSYRIFCHIFYIVKNIFKETFLVGTAIYNEKFLTKN